MYFCNLVHPCIEAIEGLVRQREKYIVAPVKRERDDLKASFGCLLYAPVNVSQTEWLQGQTSSLRKN